MNRANSSYSPPPALRSRMRSRGSAMVIALLLMVVSGVLMAGWMAIAIARSGMTEQMSTASQRRIAMENSKALAQEFMLERVLPSLSGAGFDYDLPDPAWGGIQVDAWNKASMDGPMRTFQKAAGYNHFNPGNGDGYTMDMDVEVRDGQTDSVRKYQIKSRSPLLSGVLLSSETPTLQNGTISIGAIDVDGAAFVWQSSAPGVMTFTPDSYSVNEGVNPDTKTFHNSSGTALLPSNFALPRMIANPRIGEFYFGQFDALHNNHSAANSTYDSAAPRVNVAGSLVVNPANVIASNGIIFDGGTNVEITLNTLGLNSVYISGPISLITLHGQVLANDISADGLSSIIIMVEESIYPLPTIILEGHNNRRVILAVKKNESTGILPLQFTTAAANWRMLLEVENATAQITTVGATELRGGIRSDRSITLAGGMRLTRESDPKKLERLATRVAWVESYGP